MSYKIKTIEIFEKQAKRLIKKYPSLKNELLLLVKDLKENPQQGTGIGKCCYKIRIAIASRQSGKSGGGRVITNIVISENTVYMLSIYDKAEKENLTEKELTQLLKDIPGQ